VSLRALRAPGCALVGALLTLVPLAAARAADAEPSITVTPGDVAPGDTVVVRLDHWPATTANVSVCGNQANRGSEDCDLRGAQGVGVKANGPTLLTFPVTVPPVGCPCVVRAESPTGGLVRTVSIELRGVPVVAPLAPGGPPAADQVVVRSAVRSPRQSWPGSWSPLFAGAAQRTLVVTLRNRGATALTGMRIVAFVGRDRSAGEPVASSAVSSLAPNATETVEFPVELSAPTWGRYVVFGKVYGLARPVSFASHTDTTPWGFQVLLPLALLVVARILRRRERGRRRVQEPVELAPAMALSQRSPDVVTLDEGRYGGPVYDPEQRQREESATRDDLATVGH
jgi:hypothetical protein